MKMKKAITVMGAICLAVVVMLLAFFTSVKADSPPNRCDGFLPCEPTPGCGGGVGDVCKPKHIAPARTPPKAEAIKDVTKPGVMPGGFIKRAFPGLVRQYRLLK